jgi:hypothetical protein
MPTTETLNQSPAISPPIENADLLWVWDNSVGALRSVTRANLVGATLLNNGTINTNGATFTIPAAGGTAAILNTAVTSYSPVIIGSTTAGTATYSTQVGRYSVINGIAFVFGRVIWSGHTGTGIMTISIPVTSAAITGLISPGSISYSGITTSNPDSVISLGVGSSSSSAIVYSTNSGSGGNAAVVSIDPAGDIAFSITYITS